MWSTTTALLLLATAVASETLCPNASAPTLTLVAGSSCEGTGSTLCYVDRTCSTMAVAMLTTKSRVANVSRVGDLSAYSGSRLFFENSPRLVFDESFQFPPYLFVFGVERCNVSALPPMPPSASCAYLRFNRLTRLPTMHLAKRMSEFWADNNLLTDMAAIPIPTFALYVVTYEWSEHLPHGGSSVLENNRIEQLVNLTLDTKRLYFSGNPLKTIQNVNFSSTVDLFNCSDCHLTTLSLSQSSYETLNGLRPGQLLLGSTTLNASACNATGGAIAVLQTNYTACVTQPAVIQAPTQTTNVLPWILLAVVVVVVVVAFVTRRHQRRAAAHKATIDDDKKRPTRTITFPSFSDRSTDLDADDDDLRAKLGQLQLHRVEVGEIQVGAFVAEGGHGAVYQGTYRTDTVALKTLSPHKISASNVESFLDEILLLSILDCRHIVRLVGVAWTKPADVVCLQEYMDGGDLRTRLLDDAPFPWTDKLVCVTHLVDALVYIHSLNVLHRDIKSRNILYRHDVAEWKLADFGVAREDADGTMTCGVGTSRWTAPEVLQGQYYSSAADVYSFGVVLSELDTHALPYADVLGPNGQPLAEATLVQRVCAGELTPTFQASCPAWVRSLAADCLCTEPARRPTALTVASRLLHLALADTGEAVVDVAAHP
ncbi:TKL protein kinase [Saprolegnia parasitica CBS 223.65]|uniref:TKL protein kinase n=1 Tax=Saprolegnia parasitica (strain CBS 223.65) TaxID=695850 RepID=A0A067C9H0_SAPPC|nr:TKL protein kinase [Saprolegnia parasitica CBS 223.65]KDO23467.1 TKL protein kinase [Saprolegnia parasitica CBS 223.65]|eukprot:XP_012205783.1 TKL protein kinase [Saprolegnia parasitica CBS 223.65]